MTDINDTGQGRIGMVLSGCQADRMQLKARPLIELLKRVSQVRILPGAR
ncbi:hypothetical protein [Streptomyces xiaopingdaonensis]|nr:hypothetical protein [Streptomyces xiaopingdaonensis]